MSDNMSTVRHYQRFKREDNMSMVRHFQRFTKEKRQMDKKIGLYLEQKHVLS
jgi:hypothetical protein